MAARFEILPKREAMLICGVMPPAIAERKNRPMAEASWIRNSETGEFAINVKGWPLAFFAKLLRNLSEEYEQEGMTLMLGSNIGTSDRGHGLLEGWLVLAPVPAETQHTFTEAPNTPCLLYTSPSPRDS